MGRMKIKTGKGIAAVVMAVMLLCSGQTFVAAQEETTTEQKTTEEPTTEEPTTEKPRPAKTVVSGIFSPIIKKTIGTSLDDTICVIPAYGRTVYLQNYRNGKWYTEKIYKTANKKTVKITLHYPNKRWWYTEKTKWRVYLPKTNQADGYISHTITVIRLFRKTSLSHEQTSVTKKARSTWTDTVMIAPAYGRQVKLQYYSKGKWYTLKTFRTAKTKVAKLKVTFPSKWWYVTTSKWRIYVPKGRTATAVVSKTITIHTTRYYQNPAGWYQISQNNGTMGNGGYNLSIGYMGLKVDKVNRYFGIGDRNWPRYTYTTASCVRNFQRKHGLSETGVVNEATWCAMGFSSSSWYTLGAYHSPIRVTPASTRSECIEAMIARAYEYYYAGTPYVVGASGRPGEGVDCSGLVMQALFAAGINMYPTGPVRHAQPAYEYESYYLWANSKTKWVPYSQRQRGDLIFYQGSNGVVNHIGIYLGNNMVIESFPNKVVVWPIVNAYRTSIKCVKRVFY